MAYMWKSSRHLQMELPSPVSYGWVKGETFEPVLSLQPAAPMAMLALLKCHCKTGCSSGRCGCKRNKLNCTDACSCGDCENQRTEKLDCISEVDDSNDNEDL